MPNRSDKRHNFLSLRDRRAVERATSFAPILGLPLTHSITVHWGLADGPCGGTWRAQFSTMVRQCKRWARHKGAIWAATAVHEQGGSKEVPHSHLAIHMPPRLVSEFETYLKRLVDGRVESVVLVAPLKPPLGAAGWARYQTKGIHPRYWDKVLPPVRKEDRNKAQGPIFGRRIYISRSIGAVAQAKCQSDQAKPPALSGNADIDQRIIERWQRRQSAA